MYSWWTKIVISTPRPKKNFHPHRLHHPRPPRWPLSNWQLDEHEEEEEEEEEEEDGRSRFLSPPSDAEDLMSPREDRSDLDDSLSPREC